MGDFDWNGERAVQVATVGMRQQANRWNEFSDIMRNMHAQIGRLTLTEGNFTVVDPAAAPVAQSLARSYTEMQTLLSSLIGGAAEEFDRMGRALRVSADRYDDSDRTAAGLMQGVW